MTANSAPTAGTYANTAVTGSGNVTVTPNAAPADNGTLASVTATAAPNTFTGMFSGNPTTGALTIMTAGPAGSYTITVTVTDNCGATVQKTFTLTVTVGGLQFYPLPYPVRLLDTRSGATAACNNPGAPLTGGSPFTLMARGACQGVTIPANALAVVGNATVVNFLSGGGYITLYPSDATQPLVSNLNYVANHVVPNAFTVGLGTDGAFKIFATATTHFVVDITGYYAPPGVGGLYYHPLPTPVRRLDTRLGETAACTNPGVPLNGGTPFTQAAQGLCQGVTISATAQAVVGNATVVNFLSGGGYITLWPAGASQPLVSNLNYNANHIVPNAFVVKLGTGGAFNIFATSTTHFIVDLWGYFAP